MKLRVGQGFDSHNIKKGENIKKPLIVGGIVVSNQYELIAHSDGDVLIHAVIDSILGALCLGDIGEWFNDKDPSYKNARGEDLLKEILKKTGYQTKWEMINLDSTVVLQEPKVGDLKTQIQKNLADLLGVGLNVVSVKYKTFENPDSAQIWAYSSLLIKLKK